MILFSFNSTPPPPKKKTTKKTPHKKPKTKQTQNQTKRPRIAYVTYIEYKISFLNFQPNIYM